MRIWLVCSTLERAVPVRALVGDIVLRSWTRHCTVTVPFSSQVYKWVLANLMLGDNPVMDQHPIQGGVEIYFQLLHATETVISSDLMGHLACMQTLISFPDLNLTCTLKIQLLCSSSWGSWSILCTCTCISKFR